MYDYSTLSMQKALSILGYPNPYHWASLYDSVRDCELWQDLISSKFEGKGTVSKADFDRLLGHCGALTDMPCMLFAAELMKFYPDAKIILVERDIDAWYKSWSAFLDNAFNPALSYLSNLDPWFLGRIVGLGNTCIARISGGAKTSTTAKARSKEIYRKHYALIRSLATKGRVLEFKLADGWRPLCEILDKPIPNVPFPHENDTARNTQSFKELLQLGLKNILRNAVVLATVVGVPSFALYWLRVKQK